MLTNHAPFPPAQGPGPSTNPFPCSMWKRLDTTLHLKGQSLQLPWKQVHGLASLRAFVVYKDLLHYGFSISKS